MITLGRKLSYQIALLILCLLVVGGAGLWGVEGLRSDFSIALAANQRLRSLYEIGTRVKVAQAYLALGPAESSLAADELHRAWGLFEVNFSAGTGGPDGAAFGQARDAIADALATLSSPKGSDSVDIDRILKPIADLDAQYRRTIQDAQQRADGKREQMLLAMSCLLAAAALGAGLVGRSQYVSVMKPLRELRRASQRIASGEFSQRVPAGPTAEFTRLADDFNRMAAELEELYRDLHEKVQVRSRELLRNERLASVGFLAAGVAHEINNPLGIITAHAEVSLQAPRDGADMEQQRRGLEIICQEAFRCKAIVQKLLAMARGPAEPMIAIALNAIIQDVAQTLSALPEFQSRGLKISAPETARIRGRPEEIKQVLLNLLFNAVQATPPGGNVTVELKQNRQTVELAVSDTGRGMTLAMIERAFEPFYSDPRGKALAMQSSSSAENMDESHPQRGTGLGLSIAQAIIARHGGDIRAFSSGPDQGSRFVVTIPSIDASVVQGNPP